MIKVQNASPYILGLDVGSNSIGWAVVCCSVEKGVNKEKGETKSRLRPTALHSLNARIFQEMVDANTRVPKNQKRRQARSVRNRLAYYKQRRKELIKLLLANDLLPSDFTQCPETQLNCIDRQFAERMLGKRWSKRWSSVDRSYVSPYAIRALALTKPLERYEFGRLLLHLQRRRGYFSNRGAKYVDLLRYLGSEIKQELDLDKETEGLDKEGEKEAGKVLKGIGKLAEALGERTLGQYIWDEAQCTGQLPRRITQYAVESQKARGEGTETVSFFARREMYQNEFDRIWQKQADGLVIGKLYRKIEYLLFYQRPLQSQKGKVANCNLEPNKKRAAIATLAFQEVRMHQMVNHLKVNNQALSEAEREVLHREINNPKSLNQAGRLSKDKVARLFGVKKNQINFSSNEGEDTKTGLVGNRTVQTLCNAVGGSLWYAWTPDQHQRLVEIILTTHDKLALYKTLVNKWKLTPGYNGQAYALTTCELEEGYGKHCLKVLNRLLPYLRNGDLYNIAVKKAGYLRVDQLPSKQHRLLKPDDVKDIANPIVQKALWEIRRVVNAIIKRHGFPEEIRIELARDMKVSKKHRQQIESQQAVNREQNAGAEKAIRDTLSTGDTPGLEFVISRSGQRRVSSADRNKYKMWQYEQNKICPYCGKCICNNELFGGGAEIEHILPQVGFRQNYMNTVVAHTHCNQQKGMRTPFETWGDTDRWQLIENTIAKMSNLPDAKKKRIRLQSWQPEEASEFVERQLNETRYIAVAAKNMLLETGCAVGVSSGGAVGQLRNQWGVNNVLPRHTEETIYADSGEYDEKRAKEVKNRRDHRHHAIDAFIVAMTDQYMLHRLTKRYQYYMQNKRWPKEKLPLPESWEDSPNLHALLEEKLLPAVVSHMSQHKITGALHEETAYGKRTYASQYSIDNVGNATLRNIRKYLSADPNAEGQVAWVESEVIRDLLLDWLQENEPLKVKDRRLPTYIDGLPLKKITLNHRCYTVRKALKELADKNNKLKLKPYFYKEWKPGKKTWVADEQTHESLRIWLKNHTARDLEKAPPRLLDKKGKPGQVIRRLTIAKNFSAKSIVHLKNNKTFALGSNHHVEIFWNGKAEGESERCGRMVTMLEAALRAAQKKPIVQREPGPGWQDDWQFEMDLATNDLVYWLGKIHEKDRFDDSHLEQPVFRVQKITEGKIVFRHYSVTSSKDTDNWGVIRSAPNALNCKKVHLGNLGWTPDRPKIFTSDD